MQPEETITIKKEYNKTLSVDETGIEVLVDGFLSGSRDDTEELIKVYYKTIYLNCLRITRNDTTAEDLTHETFIRALKYKHTYDKNQKFLFWILKISANVCLYYFYRQNTKNKATVSIESLESDEVNFKELQEILTDKKAEARLDKNLEKELISDAVNLLPDIYRLPIILKYYYDFSYEEVAGILEKPMGTIKFRFNKAKKILAKFLLFLRE